MSKRYRRKNKDRIIYNKRIRFPKVRVLNEKDDSIGIMPAKQALSKARQQDKDLVLITDKAKPPVVKIIELSKYKYQQQQKRAEARKKNKTQELKEVRLTIFMGNEDLKIRLKKIKNFLKDNNKVRLSLQFRGRQITKKEFAYDLFNQIIDEIKSEELGKVEIKPKIMGRRMMAQLTPAQP